MGFLSLLEVASLPVLQILLISALGAFLASDRCKLLHPNAINSLNKIVFAVFTPCLIFADLAKTVTFEDIVSWWFMPVNTGLTFLIGGMIGWLVIKILRPKPHLEGLIVATCSAGNLGNLPLILVPAICDEEGSPFGSRGSCRSVGLSYASFSMALGGFYIWTYTYQLVRSSATKFKALEIAERSVLAIDNDDVDSDLSTGLIKRNKEEDEGDMEEQVASSDRTPSYWREVRKFFLQILKELCAPPTVAAIVGLLFGATKWLRNLIIGGGAPLRVIQDSVQTLGDGTIPSIMLILGGNLTKGLRSPAIKPGVIFGVVCARFIILPIIGIGVVKLAATFHLLPADPLFQYVLMLQYTMPPAISIGTIAQLFNVGQDECSVLFIWTYLVAAFAVTLWSTVFLSILS